MGIWREDDPPFNVGKPRESVLWRKSYRLRILAEKRPGRFEAQLAEAERLWREERDRNDNIDMLLSRHNVDNHRVATVDLPFQKRHVRDFGALFCSTDFGVLT
jgi:hypothetical protein